MPKVYLNTELTQHTRMMTSGRPGEHSIQPSSNVADLRQFLQQEEHISGQDFDNILLVATEVLRRCVALDERGTEKGLIYGNIQSGKTAVIITTMALALDNGYRNFVVLTADLNDLYQQTLDRIQRSLHGLSVLGKRDFTSTSAQNSNVPWVLISTKNPTMLPRLSRFISNSNRQNQTFIIIDDEADQASLNTNTNNNRPPSTVNREIANLRNSLLSHVFLQTTATPQALLLQDCQDSFRPDFVVVTRPGAAYVGGNHFFGSDDFSNSPYLRLIPTLDLSNLRSSQFPQSIENSLYVFFIGAAILRLGGSMRNYAYLLHTSFKQADHTQAAILVTQFVTRLTNELTTGGQLSAQTMTGFSNAYSELQRTFSSLPSLQDTIQEVENAIASTIISEINSTSRQGVNPNPSRRHTIYIGGLKIGRGVTIANLLVTYYGRDAQRPQMDTVLQHARMYGYRQNELPAIRVYLPLHLAQRFFDIHASDDAVRHLCEATNAPVPVIPLSGRMQPTRRNVLNQNTVDQSAYLGGSQYFPRQPLSEPAIARTQTLALNNLLPETVYTERHPYVVSIDELLAILNFRFGTPGASGAWNDDLIRQALLMIQSQSQFNNQGSLVIVNRSSNVSRSPQGLTRAIIPGNAGNPPYGVNRNLPALLLTRLTGTTARGWDGEQFWVPVLRFPDGNYAFAANYS
jgi:hypothetical protein